MDSVSTTIFFVIFTFPDFIQLLILIPVIFQWQFYFDRDGRGFFFIGYFISFWPWAKPNVCAAFDLKIFGRDYLGISI